MKSRIFLLTACFTLLLLCLLVVLQDWTAQETREESPDNGSKASISVFRRKLQQPGADSQTAADAFQAVPPRKSPDTGASTTAESPSEVLRDRILTVSTKEDYQRLLQRIGELGITPVRLIPRLHAAVISAQDLPLGEGLGREFPELNEELDFPVTRPELPDANTVINGRPFDDGLLPWLGISETDARRGQGVTIAVLDEPVAATASLDNASVHQLDLFGLCTGDSSGSHGNAVTSLLVADSQSVRGIAPEAGILSIPVLNTEGTGSVAAVAEGIIAAVDSGADIITLSLGSETPSRALQKAVDYAVEHGTVIVAAAGNSGTSTPYYPAACEGVIGVAACDAASNAMSFSNHGDAIDIAAPGCCIAADFGTGGESVLFSGTSAAAPCVAGVIATVLSASPDMTPAEAAQTVLDNTYDFGAPGTDSQYGHGVLSYTLIREAANETYTDAVATGQYLDLANAGTDSAKLYISAQNAGNTTLSGLTLVFSVNGIEHLSVFNDVGPRQTVTATVDVPKDQWDSIVVRSKVTSSEQESNEHNNSRSTRITVIEEEPIP